MAEFLSDILRGGVVWLYGLFVWKVERGDEAEESGLSREEGKRASL